ncbi:MAG TPA: hypothetical protein VJ768_04135 [Anaerolineales bacterium]|nr:hypothetical protein [Anaerolineales bacterium]
MDPRQRLRLFASVVVFEAFHVPLSDQILRVLGGVAIGIVQWLVLRRQVSGALWWVPTTTLGIAAADIVARLAGRGEVVVWAAALGAVTGASLIWLLRRTAYEVPATA